MNINFQKSCCLRVGPRCDVTCAVISGSNGRLLPWVTEMRYVGVFFTNSRILKCLLDAAKRGFYRAANSIFGKVGRIAFERVALRCWIWRNLSWTPSTLWQTDFSWNFSTPTICKFQNFVVSNSTSFSLPGHILTCSDTQNVQW